MIDSIFSAETYANHSDIDPVDNLKNSAVYIQSGEHDEMVPPVVQELQKDFYQNFRANVTFDLLPIAHHPADGFEFKIAH